MTQVIDGRVVEMKFDNSDFEKNVAQSLSTIEKLKQALNFDSAKNIQDLGKATKSFDMSNVSSTVDQVQSHFSALQVIGYTALSEITKAAMHLGSTLINKVISPIKSGGMNRALNIEQAKFQLEGLGVAWQDIEADINYGVKDTAYGLDVAARAAAQLTASGVTLGDNMSRSLRAISGVAAMTNSTYEEISPIFTTVAGQGKVMTMQLRQLESRGLNAAATLAQSLGKTEAEVRDMVTKGQIDFQTFANAMDDAFGAHAKDANKTFTGAMSNVRAALSRIGANFATPYMDNMRLIFVNLIDVINNINKAMGPIYKDVASIMEMVQKGITGFLKNITMEDVITPVVNSIRNAFYALLLILEPIKNAFKEVFPADLSKKIKDGAQGLEKFTSKLSISEKDAANVKDTFKGLFSILDILGKAFKAAFNAITPFSGGLSGVLSAVLSFTGSIGRYITSLDEVITKNDIFGKVFNTIASVIRGAASVISGGLGKITDSLKEFKKNHIDNKDFSGISNFFTALKSRLSSFKGIGDILKSIFNGIIGVLNDFSPVFQKIVEFISGTIGSLLKGFSDAFKGGTGDAFSAFLNIFSTASIGTMVSNIALAFAQLGKSIKTMGGLSPILTTIRTGLSGTFKQLQADLKADVLTKLAKAIAIFAASILVLSLIEPTRLASSIAAIELLLFNFKQFTTQMTMTVNGMSGLNAAKFMPITVAFRNLGIALLIMAAAIKVIGSMDLAGVVKGMVSIIVLTKTLTMAMNDMSVMEGKSIKVGGTMIALAVAIRVLASSVSALGGLDLASLAKGLVSVVGMLFVLTEVVKLMDGNKMGVGTGLALIEMSAALLILSSAVEKFGSIPDDIWGKGMLTVGLLTALMAVFERATSGIKGAAAVGFAFIEISAGLLIFASVVGKLGSMPLEQLAQGLIAVAGALVLMGATLGILANVANAGALLATAAALTVLGVALNLVAIAITLLAAQNPASVIGALLTLAAVIAGFAVASMLLQPVIPMMLALGATMAVLGVAVLALGAGLLLLSAACASFVAIGPNLPAIFVGLAVGLAAFAAAAMLLQPALVPMLALAGVMAVIGLATAVVGAGLMVVAAGFSMMSVLGTAGAVAVELVAAALLKLSEGVIAFAGSVAALGAAFIVISAGFTTMALTGAAASIAIGALAVASIACAASLTLLGGGATIAAGGLGLLNLSLIALLNTFGLLIPGIAAAVEAIKIKIADVKNACIQMVEDAKNAIKQGIKGVVQLGRDFVNGFIDGIKEMAHKVVETASNLARSALNAIKHTQNSNSPAKETKKLGGDFGDGYTLGIKSKEGDAAKAGQNLTNAALDPMKEGAAQIPSLFGPIAQYSKRYGTLTDNNTNSTAELRKEMVDIKKPAKEMGTEVNNLADGEDELATSTTKATAAGKEQKSFLETMKDTISNQLDIFSKFEIKQGITADTMLENMKSNIDGFASWSHRLAVLSERGIDEALYQKLAEMGPKGYETVSAFVQMTDEQLQQANQLFAQSMTLPESQAAIVQAGFTYAGEMASKGFSNALNDHKAAHDAAHGLGTAAVQGVDQALDIHSPSKVMWLRGWYAQLGFRDGLRAGQEVTMITVGQVSNAIVSMFETQLAPEKFETIGNQVVSDLFANMVETNSGEENNPIVQALISGLQTFEAVDAALTTFTRHVKDMFNSSFEIGSDGGQSMWAYNFMNTSIIMSLLQALADKLTLVLISIAMFCLKIKEMIDEADLPGFAYDVGKNTAIGLKQGIEDYAEEAISAARKMAEEVIAILASIPEVHSPSRVTKKIGGYISQGYAIGISDGAGKVYKAAKSVADASIKGMRSGRIQDVLNDEFDFNPVITPILDLSYVREQLEGLNTLMAIPVSVVGQNEGNSSKNSPNQINFTQNNYSPKALSRYEIYRQTKNQISQLKGVMG